MTYVADTRVPLELKIKGALKLPKNQIAKLNYVFLNGFDC